MLRAILLIALCAFGQVILGQSDDKEVIIIERTLDENGNEISKKITRRNGGGDLSDEQLKDIQDDYRPFGQFDIEGLGFGPELFESWGDWLSPNKNTGRPSIGLSLSFEHDRALVVRVETQSGAASSDIREGDELVSVDGVPVSSYQEIRDILSTRRVGDDIKVTIYRDGGEIDKVVKLMPAKTESRSRRFSFDDFNMRQDINLDSLFHRFQMRGMDFDEWEGLDKDDEKASLGVYIDDSSSEVIITEVTKKSAAERAGIMPGDYILSFDDQRLTSFSELRMFMAQKRRGDSADLTLLRNGKKIKVEVMLD